MIDPATPLLWLLLDIVGLVGTKYACGMAQCGACIVNVEGVVIRSCFIPVSAVADKQVTTIEGVTQGKTLHPVQEVWLEEDVVQCGCYA